MLKYQYFCSMKKFLKIANLILLSTLLFGLFGIIYNTSTTNIGRNTINQPIGDNDQHSFLSANVLGVFAGNENHQRVNQQLPTFASKDQSNYFPDLNLGSAIDNQIFFITMVQYTRSILLVFHTYDIIYPFHFFL